MLMLKAGDVKTVIITERPLIIIKKGFRYIFALCICLINRITN